MKTLIPFFFLLTTLSTTPLFAQSVETQSVQSGSTAEATSEVAVAATVMARDTDVTPCKADASGSYVTSLSCSLGTVPAADTIICSTEAGDSGPAIHVSDNINGGYDIGVYGVNNAGYHEFLMVWSFANTAAGATTVTMSFSMKIDASGFSCAAFKHGRTSAVIDPSFFGWNDGTFGASNSSTLTTMTTPAHSGDLIYCAMSASTPQDSVRTGNINYALFEPSLVNSIFPQAWGQKTAYATACPYEVTPADYTTNAGLAFLSSSSGAGIRPYQGMIVSFAKLVNGSVPTFTQLSQSVSGGIPGWFGPELDWWYNPFWSVANTYSDVYGSTTGPTAELSSTLYLPAQRFETASSATYTSYSTYNGNSPINLEMKTGHYGDGVSWTVTPASKSLTFGYYLQWDIPSTDSSSHTYGLGGVRTGEASTLSLVLAPTGSSMNLEMVGGASGTKEVLGTGTANTTYWVTGNWATGGTLEMSYYSGCPSACVLKGSKTISDPSNPYAATSFILGLVSGTQASGDHVWWRNFKMCPNAFPCMP